MSQLASNFNPPFLMKLQIKIVKQHFEIQLIKFSFTYLQFIVFISPIQISMFIKIIEFYNHLFLFIQNNLQSLKLCSIQFLISIILLHIWLFLPFSLLNLVKQRIFQESFKHSINIYCSQKLFYLFTSLCFSYQNIYFITFQSAQQYLLHYLILQQSFMITMTPRLIYFLFYSVFYNCVFQQDK
ncbi:unnamed protein product (macronuclear) [Paramecium tetraurelia]|uniref:Transmembrane protein n=1 Tax=Paramecium tetraurelia TaxID=5888 RepID=A0BEI1_PARTE|nr:uncharacterized protein GSPATT00027981001 [Paramecium tetraurelia]CAK56948.1 unnamed protein product [Paramecium tetraurelia]|eukprot:XP_001424346.1 hypothetical protein (macronuclear) [Paramecium tetraurelia strain d4-2]